MLSASGGFAPMTPWPGALPLDPAGGSAPRPPLLARAPCRPTSHCGTETWPDLRIKWPQVDHRRLDHIRLDLTWLDSGMWLESTSNDFRSCDELAWTLCIASFMYNIMTFCLVQALQRQHFFLTFCTCSVYGSRTNNRYIKFDIIHNSITIERLNIITAMDWLLDCHFPTSCFAI